MAMCEIALMLAFLTYVRCAQRAHSLIIKETLRLAVNRSTNGQVSKTGSPDAVALRPLAMLFRSLTPAAAFDPPVPAGLPRWVLGMQHLSERCIPPRTSDQVAPDRPCKQEARDFMARVLEPEKNNIAMTSNKRRLRGRTKPLMKEEMQLEAITANFKACGAPALKTSSEAELSAMIRAANDAYYGNDVPILTDNEYDILREYILEEFPENEAALEGHTNIEIAKDKVKLPYEMWSMDKIKPDTAALATWTEKFTGPHVISCKLDGVSGLYSTEGRKPKLYTRGNGKIGQDVSHMIPYLRLPKIKGVVIRGEFIVPKQVFEAKYADKFANARNLVAGAVNQKKVDADKFSDLDFVAYEVIKPELIPSKQFQFLADQSLEAAKCVSEEMVTNEVLSKLLVDWRNDYKYEIDGLICVNDAAYPRSKGNPEHAFAFKMVLSDQLAEAKVLSVIWSPSKNGYLKPRVQIEPVVLSGATIEYATGFNAKFIEESRIGVGALVQIVRSGDVIPYIISVVQPAEKPLMPSVPYEWNENSVDIVLKDKEIDATVKEKTIAGFFKTIGVDGLGAGNCRRIIEAGYDTIHKIMDMSEADFLEVEGFKEKTAAKLYGGIQEKIDAATLPQLMHATNIFGRGFGVKKFVAILESHPDILVSEEPSCEKEAKVVAVHGMAAKSAKQFTAGIPPFTEWMRHAHLQDRLVYEQETQASSAAPAHPLSGKSIVTTGVGAKEKTQLKSALTKVGAELDSSVKKNTFVVLVKQMDEHTTKAEKARVLKIPIMLVEEFLSKYGMQNPSET